MSLSVIGASLIGGGGNGAPNILTITMNRNPTGKYDGSSGNVTPSYFTTISYDGWCLMSTSTKGYSGSSYSTSVICKYKNSTYFPLGGVGSDSHINSICYGLLKTSIAGMPFIYSTQLEYTSGGSSVINGIYQCIFPVKKGDRLYDLYYYGSPVYSAPYSLIEYYYDE